MQIEQTVDFLQDVCRSFDLYSGVFPLRSMGRVVAFTQRIE